jgi:hypothetical protein
MFSVGLPAVVFAQVLQPENTVLLSSRRPRRGTARRGRLRLVAVFRRRSDEKWRQSRWQKHREFGLSVRFSTRSMRKWCAGVVETGRLPNERKITVLPWTTRENGIIRRVDGGLFGERSDECFAWKTSTQHGPATCTRIACRSRGARLHRSEIVQSRVHSWYACRSRMERARYGASRDRESGYRKIKVARIRISDAGRRALEG